MTQTVLTNQVTELAPDSGIQPEGRQLVARALAKAVADSYRLMINTQGVHWNVQGPMFYSVHKLTEEQYEDLFKAIDELAERIRALGYPAPQGNEALSALTTIGDIPRDAELQEQIQFLIEANESIAQRLRTGVAKAERNDDVKTADLLTERIGVHEESAWMLRATIAS